MASEKSLLRRISIGRSGRRHFCRQSKTHVLDKGAVMLVVKEGREERHYCRECGLKFVATARGRLLALEEELRGT